MRSQNPSLSRLCAACRAPAALAAIACALVACGGDDGPAAAPAGGGAVALTLEGTAATGAAIAAGTVDVRCDAGGGSTTTQADGRYSVQIVEGRLPCLLRVTAADGTRLHSVATGSGSSATANITPISELVVARLAGRAPAGYFDNFAAGSAIGAQQVDDAVAAVSATLAAAGIDLAAAGNPVTGTLVAAHGETSGNALDQAVDMLTATIAAGNSSLAALSDSVANASPQAAAGTLSGVPSLPAELLLKPAAPNCAALRSGRYRFIGVSPTDAGDEPDTEVITVDAAALTYSALDGPGTLSANGTCRYGGDNDDLVVSQAGVMVVRFEEGDVGSGQFRMGLLMPEQSHTLGELAGTWNSLNIERDGNSYSVQGLAITFNATGALTALTECATPTACTALSMTELPALQVTADANGALRYRNTTDNDGGVIYLYRAGGGELMLVAIPDTGGIIMATKARTNTIPAVGTVSDSWNLSANGQLRAGAPFGDSSNTIATPGDANGRYTRTAVLNFATGVTRIETLEANKPMGGFTHRLAETVTASDGSTSVTSEWVALNMRGMGVVPVVFPANNQFLLSVTKPPAQ